MPHVCHTCSRNATRRCPFWLQAEDYLVRLRLQANPFASWLPLAINAIRRTIVRHAKRQRGQRSEAGEAADWPWQNPLPNPCPNAKSDRRGHNNDCHLRMCRTWRRLGDIGKLHKGAAQREAKRDIVCVFITEMSNYLTKDLGALAGRTGGKRDASCLLINSSRGKHVKVSRAWRWLLRKQRKEAEREWEKKRDNSSAGQL